MRKLGIGYGALAGALLTAPLIALLYLAHKLVSLPYLPFDLFDWMTRLLPGSMVTFGIDMMIDTIRLFGAGVAGTARTAEKLIAVVQLFLMGVAGGIIFFAVFRAEERPTGRYQRPGRGRPRRPADDRHQHRHRRLDGPAPPGGAVAQCRLPGLGNGPQGDIRSRHPSACRGLGRSRARCVAHRRPEAVPDPRRGRDRRNHCRWLQPWNPPGPSGPPGAGARAGGLRRPHGRDRGRFAIPERERSADARAGDSARNTRP